MVESRPGIISTTGNGPSPYGVRTTATSRAVLERDLHAAPGRVEMGQGVGVRRHRARVRGLHLVDVLDEDELREVVVRRGLGEVLAAGPQAALLERLAPQLLVLLADGHPGSAPLGPGLDGGGDPGEVGGRDAVGGEARRPVRDRGGDSLVHPALLPRGCWPRGTANECSLVQSHQHVKPNDRCRGRLQTSAASATVSGPTAEEVALIHIDVGTFSPPGRARPRGLVRACSRPPASRSPSTRCRPRPAQFRSLVDGDLQVALTSPDNVLAYRFNPRNPLGRARSTRGSWEPSTAALGLGLYGRPGSPPDDLRGARIGVDVPQLRLRPRALRSGGPARPRAATTTSWSPSARRRSGCRRCWPASATRRCSTPATSCSPRRAGCVRLAGSPTTSRPTSARSSRWSATDHLAPPGGLPTP